MATYKVIQDIEAEDHILGPLSLRQFIFAIIAAVCFYICYLLISKGVAFLTPIFILPGLFTAFFAFPFGKDQPTEIWALAKIRFLFKPRRRIWDQSGVKELVTVTVPKKIEEHLSNGLSQNEVQSRLSALASTIDSRGWAIKNVNVNLYAQPGMMATQSSSDRLVDVSSLPQEVPNYDVQAADDILDPQNNPIAQQFDQMINASTQAHHQQLVAMMDQPATSQPAATQPPNNYWFLNQTPTPTNLPQDQAVFAASPVVAPGSDDIATNNVQPTAEELALAERFKLEEGQPDEAYAHMKTILPLDEQAPVAAPAAQAAQAPVAPTYTPATQLLANNNDLNVATIAREAGRANSPAEHFGDDEVVISLH